MTKYNRSKQNVSSNIRLKDELKELHTCDVIIRVHGQLWELFKGTLMQVFVLVCRILNLSDKQPKFSFFFTTTINSKGNFKLKPGRR